MSNQSKQVVVIADNEPTYPDPIQVKQGDILIVGEEDPEYRGWIWCENQDGKCGWVPGDCIETTGSVSKAKYNYSAVELGAVSGEHLLVIDEKNGWALCSKDNGQLGWLPLSKVTEIK
jgi:SH3-like domain-containing protein